MDKVKGTTLLKKVISNLLYPGHIRGVALYLDKSLAMQWHCKLTLRKSSNLPFWVKKALTPITCVFWYCIQFWIEFFTFLIKKNSYLILEPIQHNACVHFNQLSIPKQVSYLLYAGLWLGISPINFLALPLSSYSPKKWKLFIFFEETRSWYGIHNINTTQQQQFKDDHKLLTDKYLFSERLSEIDVPTISILGLIDDTKQLKHFLSTIDKESKEQNYFLKPQGENAKRGCIELSNENNQLSATGYDLEGVFVDITNKKTISKFIKNQLKQLSNKAYSSYLIQPLLKDEFSMSNALNTQKLSILRVITINHSTSSQVIHAHMEISETSNKEEPKVKIININIDKGELNSIEEKNLLMPYWKDIINHCLGTHQLFPSIYSIAWDICISDQGIKIIEGNFGWNSMDLQVLNKKPALPMIGYSKF